MKFLLLDNIEAFYGGAAGGGKSDALLMAALMYVDIPGYNAILFRRTYAELTLPEALMDRAFEWLGGTDARWSWKDHSWTFPLNPPSRVSFGYLQHSDDKYRYQSAAFQSIGFDELPQFPEADYRYLFSRLRRLEGVDVPLRMRGAGNPEGKHVEWVYRRFINPPVLERPFIPARLDDNPYLDRESYVKSLMHLDPITRKRLLEGDWEIRGEGRLFKRSWFKIVEDYPQDCNLVRYWDLASTVPERGKSEPAYTVGALVGEKEGIYYIIDIKRDRLTPQGVESLIKQTAQLDATKYGRGRVRIYIEQEPGSSGVAQIDHYQREVLKGYTVRGDKVTGPN